MYVIGFQSLQARLDTLHHVLAMIASGIGIARCITDGILGCNDEPVTPSFGKTADHAFGGAFGVAVGRVIKVAAAVDIGVEDLTRLGCGTSEGGSECHGSKRQRRDAQAGAAQEPIRYEINEWRLFKPQLV
jgi:hypothetical protein